MKYGGEEVPEQYDVVIIGAGPAGLTAGEELARSGRSVLILEKNEEIGPKICAGGLPTKITELGIPLDIADRQFTSIKAHTGNKSYVISLPWVFLSTIDRQKLGRFLLNRAVSCGAEVRTGAYVKRIQPGHVSLDGRDIHFRHLIGADSSASITRKHLGLKIEDMGVTFQYRVPWETDDIELYVDAHTFGSGLGWVVPHAGYTIIGLGWDAKERKERNLKQTCRRWCRERGLDIAGASEEHWFINYDYRGWHFDNVFLVGDAAGFASGLTGEGIYYAMLSGREAARKIIDPAYPCPGIEEILKKKRAHERLLRLMQLNRTCLNLYFRTLLNLTRSQWWTRRFNNFFF
ncbi:MAG: geranylgeranyl reductase family protein [candidate division Zixibacteria bacterium]|nr:geranylgeranyl reductase family protein [candidate division Zixibacteria bacterium]